MENEAPSKKATPAALRQVTVALTTGSAPPEAAAGKAKRPVAAARAAAVRPDREQLVAEEDADDDGIPDAGAVENDETDASEMSRERKDDHTVEVQIFDEPVMQRASVAAGMPAAAGKRAPKPAGAAQNNKQQANQRSVKKSGSRLGTHRALDRADLTRSMARAALARELGAPAALVDVTRARAWHVHTRAWRVTGLLCAFRCLALCVKLALVDRAMPDGCPPRSRLRACARTFRAGSFRVSRARSAASAAYFSQAHAN